MCSAGTQMLLALAIVAIAAPPVPTDIQTAYQEREVSQFMHFSMCTYAGCEQDTACQTNKPELFNPVDLDTDQWIATAKALGAKQICLTAHHTGGFALWQTKLTNYSVAQSKWRGGKGDVVAEFTASCKKAGISPCFYFINDWDCFESHDDPATYLRIQLSMLTELLTKYGQIDRLWFDFYGNGCQNGWCPGGLFPNAWANVTAHVRKISPMTMMLPLLACTREADRHAPP